MVKWWAAASPLLLTMQPLALTMQPSALPAPAKPRNLYRAYTMWCSGLETAQSAFPSMRDLDGFAHVCAAVLWLKADRNGCLGGGE